MNPKRRMTRLRRQRIARGLSTRGVAEKLSEMIGPVSISTVRAWERGLFSPRPEYVPALANLLGVSPDDLLDMISATDGVTA